MCSGWWVSSNTIKIWILINLVSTFADGFYRRFTLKDGLGYTTHVWFSHSLTDNQSSTYIIHRCPEQAKDLIIAYTNKETIPMLLRPMAIDVFLSEYVLNAWSEAVVPRRDRLIFFVCVAEILHRLNLPWHYIPGKNFHPEFLAWTYLSSSGRAPSLVSVLSYHSGGPSRYPGGNSVSPRTS